MGSSHIPQRFAMCIKAFDQENFNPWLNLQRPCLYATSMVSPKGKVRKRHKHADVKTPLERLALLCDQHMVVLTPPVPLSRPCTLKLAARPIWRQPKRCNKPSTPCSQASKILSAGPDGPHWAPPQILPRFACLTADCCAMRRPGALRAAFKGR